jgi:Tfp pilus assembly major pilin PilA
MKRMQSGMTLIGFIIVLAVVGVFVYMGMKLIPMYSEYYAVKQALNGLASEPGVVEQDAAKIKDLFFRRLYISYADNIKAEHVKVVRKDAGWQMTVDYEIRKPLIANLDVIGRFHAEKELRRGAVD